MGSDENRSIKKYGRQPHNCDNSKPFQPASLQVLAGIKNKSQSMKDRIGQ